MTEEKNAAELAQAIDESRGPLISFVLDCSEGQWHAAPVDGDPRPVGIIADHVADAYEYLAGWIADLTDGKPVDVDSDVVDGLNAAHAGEAVSVTPGHVAEHLRSSGDAIIALVAGLEPDQLDLGYGQVRRFAMIAARHAENHRAEIEQALAAAGFPPL